MLLTTTLLWIIAKWPTQTYCFGGKQWKESFVNLYILTCALKKVAINYFIYDSSWIHKNDRLSANNPKESITNRTQTTFIPQPVLNWLFASGNLPTNELWVVYEPHKAKVNFICTCMDFSGMKFHSFDQFLKGLQDRSGCGYQDFCLIHILMLCVFSLSVFTLQKKR